MTHEMVQQQYEDLFELDIRVSSSAQPAEIEQAAFHTKIECSNFITCHCVSQKTPRDAQSRE